jgi:hypothetical protein
MQVPVRVRRVVEHTVLKDDGEGGRSPSPSSWFIIQLVSADGLIHVRISGADKADYPPGAEYDITVTPR